MSWETVKPGDVEVNEGGGFSPLEAGEVTANLLPVATYREGRGGVQELVIRAAITDGPQKGRQFFLQYPDPTAVSPQGKPFTWSAKAAKKLLMALGIDANEGEDFKDALNRAASNGHSMFKITLAPGTYIPQGQTAPRVEPQLFTVGVAA